MEITLDKPLEDVNESLRRKAGFLLPTYLRKEGRPQNPSDGGGQQVSVAGIYKLHSFMQMYSHLEIAQILRLFPECPRVEPLPSPDEIVCYYLRQHDVNIKPVSSDVQPSRLTNATMGAMGADYLAVNTHLTAQKKSSALQEWTSWKQWALSQPDFKHFKRSIHNKFNTAKSSQDRWLSENQASISARLEEEKVEIQKEQRFAMKILSGVVCLILLIAGLEKIVSQFNPPSSLPTTTEQS